MLTYNSKIWTKKDQDLTFDVPMGSYFGAELCNLVGLYILDRLQKNYMSNQIGLYRVDGLAINKYKNNQDYENIKNQTIKIFEDIGFSITINIGITRCNFLDITLDLTNSCYMAYRKENSLTRYINFNSNHPTIIRKNLPKMIEKRLNRLSSDPQIFDNAKHSYQDALRL